MKNWSKAMAFILMLLSVQLQAQTTNGKNPPKNSGKSAPVKRQTAPTPKVEVTITLKNLAETNVAVFAGSKEGIRNPDLRTLGGRSNNVVYLKTGDVVCIMTAEKKALSCADIKPATTIVEINASGTVITAR